MKLFIQRRQLAAALHFASNADLRQYLNGIYVVTTETETRLIASTGAVIATQRADAANEILCNFIMPRSAVETAIKIKAEVFTIDYMLETNIGTISAFGQTVAFVPLEGRYPDVQRVIPHQPDGTAGDFDPELINRFVKAAKDLGAKPHNVLIRQNGVSPALVQIIGVPDFCGVVSPYQHFSEKSSPPRRDPGLPTWAF